MKFFRITIALALLSLLSACKFSNDMALPKDLAYFTTFEVEGQKSVKIDKETRHVTVTLAEAADVSHLKVLSSELCENATYVDAMPAYLDLSKPYNITLRYYRDFVWTIEAQQPVERYITVKNQIGDAEFNEKDKQVIVYVTKQQSLLEVEFQDVKLGQIGSELVSTRSNVVRGGKVVMEEVECNLPQILECVNIRYFKVNFKGVETEWAVKVLNKAVSQEIKEVNAWTDHADVKAIFNGQGSPAIEYKLASDAEWKNVPDITVAGVGISCTITDLEPGTEYMVRVRIDSATSPEVNFTTETKAQLENMRFDEWHLDGKIWYPYDAGAKIWDSANPGSAAFIGSPTTPEEKDVVKGKAARMESKYAVIAFAAGNIYTGRFDKISGVGAELDWGVPFTTRPTALEGYYKYQPKKIDYADAGHASLKGATDKCQIQVILTDWDAPFHLNTTKGIFVDVAGDPHIIAYGKLETDEASSEYQKFTIPLEYRDRTRKPTYVVISCCSSYLGDYFTGAVGSVLYVDEFEFTY
ncbi:MAG: PCMD domain-containing protein [Bacteroidales bacterium]|nr:PCMD domain-containing protein [Bacteroidales bacterium]